MHLSGLFIYPVKALRGCAVAAVSVDALGLVGDRRFLVVDETGRFVTQRSHPRMALIATALDARSLTLSAENAGQVVVPRAADPHAALRRVTIWKSDGLFAEDCGDDAARWLGDFLGLKVRLVRIGPQFARPLLDPAFAGPGEVLSFPDAFPFLAISEASLGDLNERLVAQRSEAVPMDRFRPNLVIAGCAAFAEDNWPRVRVGEIVFRAGGPCTRCVVTTTDQLTARRDKEPLRTLATYRRSEVDPTDVNFGQNLVHETKSGTLHLGDVIEPLA